VAFQCHFDQELSQYSHTTVISLVDQSGKEKVISDAFLSHILTLDYSHLTYITFDFHEYWYVVRHGALVQNNVVKRKI